MVRSVAAGAMFLVAAVVLMMWLAGAFHQKVGGASGAAAIAAAGRPIGDTLVVEVRRTRVPQVESFAGTVQAVHEAAVASKLLAKVLDVTVVAGQRVTEADLLVRLDDADLRARLEQARASLRGAEAARDQASIEYERVAKLQAQGAAASIEWDRAQTALKAAEAESARSEQAVTEAQTVLGFAAVRSPISGVVIDKKVEAGDTVSPGQVLVTLYEPSRMQLVASVRESLAQKLSVGQSVEVEIDALQKRCAGRISEIVPEAQAESRSFSVKVTGPCPPGIYSGMFGRLLIPLGEQELVVIPKRAVRRVGQLDLVDAAEGAVLRRRAVQLGRDLGDEVEVLAGLRDGERVAVAQPQSEGPP